MRLSNRIGSLTLNDEEYEDQPAPRNSHPPQKKAHTHTQCNHFEGPMTYAFEGTHPNRRVSFWFQGTPKKRHTLINLFPRPDGKKITEKCPSGIPDSPGILLEPSQNPSFNRPQKKKDLSCTESPEQGRQHRAHRGPALPARAASREQLVTFPLLQKPKRQEHLKGDGRSKPQAILLGFI